MKFMRLISLFLLLCLPAFGQTVVYRALNPNVFGSNNFMVSIKSGALMTNVILQGTTGIKQLTDAGDPPFLSFTNFEGTRVFYFDELGRPVGDGSQLTGISGTGTTIAQVNAIIETNAVTPGSSNYLSTLVASNILDRSNIRFWGAIGDGVTIDTVAVSNAYFFNSTAQIIVPPGTYRMTTATFGAGGTIVFNGGSFVIDTNSTVTMNGGVVVNASAVAFGGYGTNRFNGPLEAPTYAVFGENVNITFLNNSRTLRVLYPEWWGAKSDAGTESSTAIQRAMDSVKVSAAVVQLLEGSYVVTNTLTVPQGITLRGINQRGSVLQWTGSGPGPILQTTASGVGDDQILEGFTLQNTGSAAIGILINSVRVTLDNIFANPTVKFSKAVIMTRTNDAVYNVVLRRCDINSSANGQENPIGVWFHNGHTFVVDSCMFSGNHTNIMVGESGVAGVQGFSLINSRLESFSGVAPYPGGQNEIGVLIDEAYGFNVSGNNFEMSSDQVASASNHVAIRLIGAYAGSIQGNYFAGDGYSTTSIQAVTTNAQSVIIQGNTFWRVNGYGITTTNGALLKVGRNYSPNPTTGTIHPSNPGFETFIDLNPVGLVLNENTNIAFPAGVTVQTDRLVVTNSSVGIGTAVPLALLDVNGVSAAGLGTVGAPSFAIRTDLNTGMWSSGADALDWSTAGVQRMRMTGGTIAIGTTAAQIASGEMLSIKGTTAGGVTVYNNTAAHGSIELANNASNGPAIGIFDTSGSAFGTERAKIGLDGSTVALKITGNLGIDLYHSTTKKVAISASGIVVTGGVTASGGYLGNVGLATNSAGATIDSLSGGSADGSPGVLTNQFTTNVVGQAIVGNVGIAGSLSVTGLVHTLQAGGANTLVVTNGKVSIGTSAAPVAGLVVNRAASDALNTVANAAAWFGDVAGGSGLLIQNTASSPFSSAIQAIDYGGTTRPLVLNLYGNIGMGKLVPVAKLDVTGDIRASTTVAATNGYYGRSNIVFHVPTNAPTDGQVVTASGVSGITRWASPGGAGVTFPVTVNTLIVTNFTGGLERSIELMADTGANDFVGIQFKTQSTIGQFYMDDSVAHYSGSGGDFVFDQGVSAANIATTGAASIGGAITVGGGTSVANIRHGTSGAMVLGSVTVTDTGCTANTRYFFSAHTLGTISIPGGYYASTRTASTSFVITSSQATETSTIDWMAIEP